MRPFRLRTVHQETIAMSEKSPSTIPVLLSPKEVAQKYRCSESFLAKKRMTGDGPVFIKRGRSVLYAEPALLQWLKTRTRTSTSVACVLIALVKAISAVAFVSFVT
jgi:hypothetical protein